MRSLQFHLFRGRPSFQVLGERGRKGHRSTSCEVEGEPRMGLRAGPHGQLSLDFRRFMDPRRTSNPNSSYLPQTPRHLGPTCPCHTGFPRVFPLCLEARPPLHPAQPGGGILLSILQSVSNCQGHYLHTRVKFTSLSSKP